MKEILANINKAFENRVRLGIMSVLSIHRSMDFTGLKEVPSLGDLFLPTSDRPVPGRKLRVVFRDGEQLLGTTQGYAPGRPGFFLVPADPESNIVRCYVVTAATERVDPL